MLAVIITDYPFETSALLNHRELQHRQHGKAYHCLVPRPSEVCEYSQMLWSLITLVLYLLKTSVALSFNSEATACNISGT